MDEALLQRAGELVHERWGRLGLEALLPEERDYLLLWELHAEVSSGTFDQYLLNSSGDHATEAVAALERLDSVLLLDLLQRVLAVLPGGWIADQDERCRRLGTVLERRDLFRALTDEYYEAIEAEAGVIQRAVDRLVGAYGRKGYLD